MSFRLYDDNVFFRKLFFAFVLFSFFSSSKSKAGLGKLRSMAACTFKTLLPNLQLITTVCSSLNHEPTLAILIVPVACDVCR